MAETRLLAPIARLGKVLAIGLNYKDHIAESGLATPEHQLWFAKQPTAINGPFDPIEIPRVAPTTVDCEAELVAVIGQAGRHISRDRAAAHVFGYPVDLALCSGTLIYEVLNRGNGMIDISGRSTEGALSMLDLFMDRGDIVVAAAAWQADLARPVVEPVKDQMLVGTTYSGSTMYADLPHAFGNGQPVVRRIRQEHSVFDAVGERSAGAVPLLYPAAPGTPSRSFRAGTRTTCQSRSTPPRSNCAATGR